jgi:ribosome-binding factor A
MKEDLKKAQWYLSKLVEEVTSDNYINNLKEELKELKKLIEELENDC